MIYHIPEQALRHPAHPGVKALRLPATINLCFVHAIYVQGSQARLTMHGGRTLGFMFDDDEAASLLRTRFLEEFPDALLLERRRRNAAVRREHLASIHLELSSLHFIFSDNSSFMWGVSHELDEECLGATQRDIFKQWSDPPALWWEQPE